MTGNIYVCPHNWCIKLSSVDFFFFFLLFSFFFTCVTNCNRQQSMSRQQLRCVYPVAESCIIPSYYLEGLPLPPPALPEEEHTTQREPDHSTTLCRDTTTDSTVGYMHRGGPSQMAASPFTSTHLHNRHIVREGFKIES